MFHHVIYKEFLTFIITLIKFWLKNEISKLKNKNVFIS